jgi:dimethylamine--corrinoid protein Co-methyltransferase
MGGMRTAGDLVARMQMSCGMKIEEAKSYVADKLGVARSELTDPVIMTEVRQDMQIGVMNPVAQCAKGIEAKFRIADVLGISINCVEQFKKRAGI